jgi:xyloglucan-specific endo-beta-1,4-glucanase
MSRLSAFFDKITSSRSPSPAGRSPSRPPPSLVPRQTLSTQYAYCADAGYEFNNNLWGRDDAESGSQVTHYYGPAAAAATTAGAGEASNAGGSGGGGGGVCWGSTWTWKGAPDNVKSYVWVNRQFDRPLLCDVTALPTRTVWSSKGKSVRGNVAYDIFTHRDKDHANSSGEYEVMIW